MKITCHSSSLQYLEVDDFYEPHEIESIMNELVFHQQNEKMLDPEATFSATCGDDLLKLNRSLFLDDVFADRNASDILRINRRVYDIFTQKHNQRPYPDSWFFNHLFVRRDKTLVNYYDDGMYYKPHTDTMRATAISFFYKEPKRWAGGELVFPDFNVTIQPEVGKMIVFPSMVMHEVKPVVVDPEYKNKNFGRFTVSQFFYGE